MKIYQIILIFASLNLSLEQTSDYNESVIKRAFKMFQNKKECIDSSKNTSENSKLDIMLLLDVTGSMSSWIDICKKNLKTIVDNVISLNKNLDIRLSFIGQRDQGDRGNLKDIKMDKDFIANAVHILKGSHFVVHPFSRDISAVEKLIASTSASGGGDAPEDVIGALKLALMMFEKSDKDTNKMLFLLGDAPTHGLQQHNDYSDSHPRGHHAFHLEDLMEEFGKQNIDFTTIKIQRDTDKMFRIMEKHYNTNENTMVFIDQIGQLEPSQRSYQHEATDIHPAHSKRSKIHKIYDEDEDAKDIQLGATDDLMYAADSKIGSKGLDSKRFSVDLQSNIMDNLSKRESRKQY